MNRTWLLRAFTVLAWLVASVWFFNSWTNHQPYYQSLIAFLLGSASLIGSFLPKDNGSNIELVKTAASNGSVALGNVHNSKIDIIVENSAGQDKRSQINNEMDLLIAPLYAKMNKNSSIVSFMSTHLVSRRWSFTDSQERKELENLETEIKEIMRQYGHLASDQLYAPHFALTV
jgi:putative flippase GtrA